MEEEKRLCPDDLTSSSGLRPRILPLLLPDLNLAQLHFLFIVANGLPSTLSVCYNPHEIASTVLDFGVSSKVTIPARHAPV